MNRLGKESSPYLLQHKDNPVHWYAWGEEPFEVALRENKPVLVSIGYSSCHWCHVMEHESFSNNEVADLMNELFICIKVDREEYPDIDHAYMDAVQAMTGSGGWPLNVFVTPDKKPFYGGTYFPPQRMHNRASWKEVLLNVFQFFRQNPDEVNTQAQRLVEHMQRKKMTKPNSNVASDFILEDVAKKIMAQADLEEGGFGYAPKFPSTHSLQFLLKYYQVSGDKSCLDHVLHSLNAMAQGGLYDHVGGGFARYSTDKAWKIPHFEKMLYDNALLLELYAYAFLITGKEHYKRICEETVAWLKREMTSKEGLFYAAQDADSEGEEGKYYCWTYEELQALLGADFEQFHGYFHVLPEGNWEGGNILYSLHHPENFTQDLTPLLQKLLTFRQKRIPPLTDTKVLLGWNALMSKSLIVASIYCNNTNWLHLAEQNIEALLKLLIIQPGAYGHSYCSGEIKNRAYADDLAFLASALIELAKATASPEYLLKVEDILANLFENYRMEGSILFDFTHKNHKQLDFTQEDTYDGALPSANAVLCNVIQYMGVAKNNDVFEIQAHQMLDAMKPFVSQYPSSFACWALQLLYENQPWREISIMGSQAHHTYTELIKTMKNNLPYCYVSENSFEDYACFQRNVTQCSISICTKLECLPAVDSIDLAVRSLTQVR